MVERGDPLRTGCAEVQGGPRGLRTATAPTTLTKGHHRAAGTKVPIRETAAEELREEHARREGGADFPEREVLHALAHQNFLRMGRSGAARGATCSGEGTYADRPTAAGPTNPLHLEVGW